MSESTTMNTGAEPLLRVTSLTKRFTVRDAAGRKGTIRAVEDVSFTVEPGRTVAVVGESGSGKSTLARTVNRFYRPTSGRIEFRGQDITDHSDRRLAREVRQHMQFVFQDPYSAINPRMTANEIIGEGLRIHRIGDAASRRTRVAELLDVVGLTPAQGARYPHEFSGGQRQRIGIARALALRPALLVLDEPVSALDVSIQAQIVNLLQDIQSESNVAYIFISHDLSVVRHIADEVIVMHLGAVVESGPVEQVFSHPEHAYTQSLLSAVPIDDPRERGARDRAVYTAGRTAFVHDEEPA
ncbi:ABC transporter ATP-binding protein [Microbacterium sp. ZW T5_56]|uniref:ABC transporter ATP-binding protein n=1 Tax=Microbacterium sp. ZW T5_56 TaxID=3378081 RepID=UPI003852372C